MRVASILSGLVGAVLLGCGDPEPTIEPGPPPGGMAADAFVGFAETLGTVPDGTLPGRTGEGGTGAAAADLALCDPCLDAAGCANEGRCVGLGPEGNFCSRPCDFENPCPGGYSCQTAKTIDGETLWACLPDSGECACRAEAVSAALSTVCEAANAFGTCSGIRICTADGLGPCGPIPAPEACNGVDENCDGQTDESGAALCDDGDPCTEDGCDGAAGCHHAAIAGCGTPETCGQPGACAPEAVDEQVEACGGCATHFRVRSCGATCEWGEWTEWSPCDRGAPAVCEPGDVETQTETCGDCGQRSRTRTCTDECGFGAWGAYGACEGQGVCAPGDVDQQSQSCGNCGTQTVSRTCSAACVWGPKSAPTACAGQGACAPGEVSGEGCDACAEKVCTGQCAWGSCQLKAGAECQWQEGSHWECCGAGQWHFCLPPKYGCVWSPACEACTNCGC